MNLLRQIKSISLSGRHCCAKCSLCLCLTGEPPQGAWEHLIETLTGGQESPSLHWLEEQISTTLYQEELCQGASAVDIGLSGPAAFRAEAALILSSIRPEFGYLTDRSGKVESIEQSSAS